MLLIMAQKDLLSLVSAQYSTGTHSDHFSHLFPADNIGLPFPVCPPSQHWTPVGTLVDLPMSDLLPLCLLWRLSTLSKSYDPWVPSSSSSSSTALPGGSYLLLGCEITRSVERGQASLCSPDPWCHHISPRSFTISNWCYQQKITKMYVTPRPWVSDLTGSNSVQSLSHVWFCGPMDGNMPGLPVHHQLPELAQTHTHRVGDAIQPSHPLSPSSPPAFNLSQHQGLFQWVSSLPQIAKVLEIQLQHQSFQWIFRADFL